MLFRNRKDAGQKLATKLKEYFSKNVQHKSEDLVIIGLPRGGAVVALEVAKQFGCPMDILVSKKIGFPGQPEFAIGAVSSDDVLVLNPEIPHNLQWQQYLDKRHFDLRQFSRKVETEFYKSANAEPTSLREKIAVIVDDGIATGMTAAAALKSARLRGAKTIILATPVMSRDSIEELSRYCDTIVAVSLPEKLEAVGHHYLDFTQTSDIEVIQALRESRQFSLIQHSQNLYGQPDVKN